MEMALEVLLASLVGLLGLYILIYHNFIKGKTCQNETRLQGKTVLITGGNAGIGKATALDLARRGARVVLGCRDRERAEAAVQDIRRESGNKEVVFMSLDLGSLSSVRAFAEAFLRSEPRLDILINNAGVYCVGKSDDGFNAAFQVNHLAHFLLTHLLLDRLKQCAPSRVVAVSSFLYQLGRIDFQNIHLPVEGRLGAFKSYCNSKLANVLHVRELANRLQGTDVSCYALHPGSVHTKILRYFPGWIKSPSTVASWLFFRDATNGAQTSIYCATQEGIEKLSGCYFEDCRQKDLKPNARDPMLAKKLWEFSEKLLGLAS
ncbi:dehydrogenase/reductase SDR family member 13-like [Sceloporus undulatus]|uniref:dehydrogenase/reductase SDR family member 13-like n=1 Tax=Sceloporus undulatus TaxID=8520 RepID=UPI001C4BD45E|nr:dehydrogenase/reductase SDR family member 13-like [Sceloporus undulatus]